MQKFALLAPCLFIGLLAMGQRTAKDAATSKDAVPDLSISSVSLSYPGGTKAPTLNTAHGTEQGNPNSPGAHPITQCIVVMHSDDGPKEDVVLTVELPTGVKVQQKPANATTTPGADYHIQSDGSIHIPIGHLNAGQSITVQFSYSTPPTGPGLFNQVTASVKGSKPESNMSNNTRSATLR
jgi:hypothetical protein